jgi:hypothetical protein
MPNIKHVPRMKTNNLDSLNTYIRNNSIAKNDVKLLVGPKSFMCYDITFKTIPFNIKFNFEHYQKVSCFQINWHKKSGLIKTRVDSNSKFPFTTIIDNKVYKSDKIESVINLITKTI